MASLGTVFVGVKMDELAAKRDAKTIGSSMSRELDNEVGEKAGRNAGSHFLSGLRLSASAGPVRAYASSLGSAFLGGFAAVGVIRTVQSVGTFAIKSAANLEQLRIGFTTLLGSAQAAGSFLKQIQDFANATPFEFQDVAKYAQQLLAVGINTKQIIPDLTAIGDAVSALGGSADDVGRIVYALGQMNQEAHINAGDLRQLTDVGIPALKILADGFHTTTGGLQDMITKGQITGQQAIPILVAGLEHGTKSVKGFAGAMDQQSHTFAGLLSTLHDTAQSALANGLQPLLATFEKALPRAIGLAGTALGAFSRGLSTAIPALTAGFGAFLGGFTGKDLGDIGLNTLSGHLSQLGVNAKKITDTIGALIVKLIQGLEPAVRDIWSFFTQSLLPTIANLWQALKGPLGDALALAVGAFQTLAALLKNVVGPAIRDTSKFLADHKDIVKFVTADVLAMWAAYKGFTILTAVVGGLRAATAAMLGLDAAIAANPVGALILALGATAVASYALYRNWNTIWSAISHNRDIALLVAFLGGPVVLSIAAVGTAIKIVQTVWTGGWSGLKRVALEGARTILGAFLDMASGIIHGAASAFGWVPGLGGKLRQARSAFDEFKKGVLGDLQSLEGDHVVHVNVRTAVADAANAYSLPNKAGQYAFGGLVTGPGGPRDDLIHAMLSNGEAVVPAHLVPKYAAAFASDGIPGFADGGLVVKTNAATAANGLGDQLRQVVDSALQKIANTFASFTGVIGGGVQQWAGLVSQVLAALGLSPTLLGKVLAQMTTESGGNPNIVNTSDSNAAAGHPSMGLMQVIGPTFAAYAGPYAGLGILNPFANVYAGLNYARNRYGPNLNGLGEGHGYDSGGRWPSGTAGWNTSGKDEYVITGNQMDNLLRKFDALLHLTAGQGDSIASSLNGVSKRSKLDAKTRTY